MYCKYCSQFIGFLTLSSYCDFCSSLRRVLLIYGKTIIDDVLNKQLLGVSILNIEQKETEQKPTEPTKIEPTKIETSKPKTEPPKINIKCPSNQPISCGDK